MSNLRQAAQQALEVLLEYQPNPCLIPETQEETDRAAAFWDAIDDLRTALAEPEHAELERKSDAIQRLWKERDELRSECRTLVRQNGEWQELHAELAEALQKVEGMLKLSPHALSITRAALAKARASK